MLIMIWKRLDIRLLSIALLLVCIGVGCTNPKQHNVDAMNDISYAYHYRSLDSAFLYAQKAQKLSADYSSGYAEALNNKAFVYIKRMRYDNAKQCLDSIYALTDNQLELLVADVQQMRLCQRRARNKEFYDFRQAALLRIRRIEEEKEHLSERQTSRYAYAYSEFQLVNSVYFYYVGQEYQSKSAINSLSTFNELRLDTAQLVNYYYALGSGGLIDKGSQQDISQTEFDYLMQSYHLAENAGYVYWVANCLQAISEHLMMTDVGEQLIKDNPREIKTLNVDKMPEQLLAGNLAQRSLTLFTQYGDVYQQAGALRTLASCYWQINDYPSALICLQNALQNDTIINQTPEMVASIREQLCLVYSAMNDKPSSDYNRNLYLDLQENTRQDRFYEARADYLSQTIQEQNRMIIAVIAAIIIVVGLLIVFVWLRYKNGDRQTLSQLLAPLLKWQTLNQQDMANQEEKYLEVVEQSDIELINLEKKKRRYLEQRAKVALVNSVLPLIDRMLYEVRRLHVADKSTAITRIDKERYRYIDDLVQQIITTNVMLTRWIKLREGQLQIRIESFKMQELFDFLSHSQASFQMKGIRLDIEPTSAWVKADRTLTLFMLNTLADNARKFTPKGGVISIKAEEQQAYVEITVTDNGEGMTEAQTAHLFDIKPINDTDETSHRSEQTRSHGFGLTNCMGIINKYKKTSSLFSVCTLGVDSEEGKGSRFFFRLPKGVARGIVSLAIMMGASALSSHAASIAGNVDYLGRANAYADSAYFSNINGTYAKTLLFADSCREMLNQYYLSEHPEGKNLMIKQGGTSITPAEIKWLKDSLTTNFDIVLDIRNETAVAALALHQWDLYHYNNKVYTQLFKEISSDNTLSNYCKTMQRTENNKEIAMVLLILLFLSIVPAFYFIYYKNHLYYIYCVNRIKQMNNILIGTDSIEAKVRKVEHMTFSRLPDPLYRIVEQIKQSLKECLASYKTQTLQLELAIDKMHSIQMENQRLHVCNNVMDNSLSTLKHETMYYPSRISNLLESYRSAINNQTFSQKQYTDFCEELNGLSVYYKELYQVLCLQIMEQVKMIKLSCKPVSLKEIVPKGTVLMERTENGIEQSASEVSLLGDPDMLSYLFDILKGVNDSQALTIHISSIDPFYIVMDIPLTHWQSTLAEGQNIFDADVANVPFLLCRQIVRDNGELTNRRRCGISMRQGSCDDLDNINIITITISRWNYSK